MRLGLSHLASGRERCCPPETLLREMYEPDWALATSFAGIGEKDGDRTIGAVCPGVPRDGGSGVDETLETEEVEAMGGEGWGCHDGNQRGWGWQ